MKKVYIVKIGKVTSDWGRFTGYQVIGCVDSLEKVEIKKADYKAKHEINQFWMSHETVKDENGNSHIKFYVEEMEVE